MQVLKTTQDYFRLVDGLQGWRRNFSVDRTSNGSDLEFLKNFINVVENHLTPDQSGPGLSLQNTEGGHTRLRPDYELTEARRDLVFLTDGLEGLFQFLSSEIDGFHEGSAAVQSFLKDQGEPSHIFTDRDGTVNPYASLYRCSGQSLWNAHLMAKIHASLSGTGIILTSGPMYGPGASDLTLTGPDEWILAASKGREFLDRRGKLVQEVGPEALVRAFQTIQDDIQSLLMEPKFRVFATTGSGFQIKHLQLTVARQDVNGSIPDIVSTEFRTRVKDLVDNRSSTDGGFFVEDTGLDLEILPTDRENREFDKGSGLSFVLDRLSLQGDSVLVCGDTSSDIPMVREAKKRFAKCGAIMVTTDPGLVQKTGETGVPTLQVSHPEILVTGLFHFFCNHFAGS